jgi:hypothetical protein
MGRTTIPVINMIIAAVVKVMLNWTLTAMPELGIKGAAWATVTDIGVAAVMNMYYIKKYTGFAVDYKSLSKSMIAAGAMGVIIYLVFTEVSLTAAHINYATIIAMILGSAAYGLVLLLIGGIGEHDIQRIPVVGSKLAELVRKLGLARG